MEIPRIVAKKREGEPEDWLGKIATLDHVSRVVEPPFDLVDDSGTLLAFARPSPVANLSARMKELLPHYKYGMGRRSSGMTSRSATFGFMPRDELRHPCCRSAVFHKVHPEATEVLQRAAIAYAEELRTVHPEQYELQKGQLAEVNDRWKMDGGLYTSGIINYNNTLVYHLDRGNYSDSWNAMLVVREDSVGGDLVIPEYDVAVKYADGDCIWLNAGAIVHGVTPIIPQRLGGYRISIVWYALRAMRLCGSPAEELARVREYKRKTAVARTTEGLKKRAEKTKSP